MSLPEANHQSNYHCRNWKQSSKMPNHILLLNGASPLQMPVVMVLVTSIKKWISKLMDFIREIGMIKNFFGSCTWGNSTIFLQINSVLFLALPVTIVFSGNHLVTYKIWEPASLLLSTFVVSLPCTEVILFSNCKMDYWME